jgi:LacI family transcriptional regulator
MQTKFGQFRRSERCLGIWEVARHAGVSIATVSRTINGIESVDRRLAGRVWKSVQELGYSPNVFARSLASGRTRLLGLIVPAMSDPFFAKVAQWFEETAWALGYEMLASPIGSNAERRSYFIGRMRERKVEGVAVMVFDLDSALIEEFSVLKVPIVYVNAALEFGDATTLSVNYWSGIRAGVQHLASMGHRQIAFIGGQNLTRASTPKLKAFIRATEEIGCIPWTIEIDESFEGGIRAMKELLDSEMRPTAIICSSGLVALGALRVLDQTGVDVPEQMSIIGFDDVPFAEFVNPPLTTIHIPRRDLARLAVTTLRALIETPPEHAARSSWEVPTSLIVRESTDFPAGSALSKSSTHGSAALLGVQGSAILEDCG